MLLSFIVLQFVLILICLICAYWYPIQRYLWRYLSAIVIYFPLSLYIAQFWHHGFSEDPNMWGVFGDYIGGVYNVITSVLIFYITYKIQKHDKKQETVAIELLQQLDKLSKNNYHHKTIEKVLKYLREDAALLDEMLKSNIVSLMDNYTRVRSEGIAKNLSLEKAVTNKLNQLAYGGK